MSLVSQNLVAVPGRFSGVVFRLAWRMGESRLTGRKTGESTVSNILFFLHFTLARNVAVSNR